MFDPYLDSIIIFCAINAILAWSIYLPLSGGRFFAGQMGFMALGAYLSVAMTVHFHLHFAVGMLLAVVAAAPIGAVVALVGIRLSGFSLAITSLGFALTFQLILTNTDAVGGPAGIQGIPISVGVVPAVATLLAVGVGLVLLDRSDHGRALRAVRTDPLAASACGVPCLPYQIGTTVAGAVLASVAGALYANYTGFISPDAFGFSALVAAISFAFLGGVTTIFGPLFGATLLTVLPQVFSGLYDYRLLVYAGIVILVVAVRPDGLVTRRDVRSLRRLLRPRRVPARDGLQPEAAGGRSR